MEKKDLRAAGIVTVQEIEIGEYKVVMPDFNEKAVTMGMTRKTRSMSKDDQSLELLFLVLEEYLTPEELATWDALPLSALQELANDKVADLQKK